MANRSLRIPKNVIPYLLLTPIFIFYAVFWLVPVLSSIKEVFTSMNGGFTLTENFKLMVNSDLFGEAVINTAVFTFVSVVIEYIVALVLAVILNRFPIYEFGRYKSCFDACLYRRMDCNSYRHDYAYCWVTGNAE